MSQKFAALFPGQGSQYVGMGKDLVQNFAIAKSVFDEASEAISCDLSKLCFDGPESDLKLTENTQPCLLVTSVAAFRVFSSECDLRPAVVAGHSLGEYSALVAAQCLDLATATRWVRARGKAMQTAVPAGQGGMLAVLGLDDAVVTNLCKEASQDDEVVEPANFNAPSQVVIAGTTQGIARAQKLLAEPAYKGGKGIPLAVSAPFHCRMMKPAAEAMANLFSATPGAARPLAIPYIPNTSAALVTQPTNVLRDLELQIDHPVQWSKSVVYAFQMGLGTFVEFGPGSVLQGLTKRIAKASQGAPAVSTCGIENTESLKASLKILGALS